MTSKEFFWTFAQHKLLCDDDTKRLVMLADFGTGKTSLLFEKSKRLLRQGKKVLVVIFEVGYTLADEDSSASASVLASGESGKSVESILTTQYRLELEKLWKKKRKPNKSQPRASGPEANGFQVVRLIEKGNEKPL